MELLEAGGEVMRVSTPGAGPYSIQLTNRLGCKGIEALHPLGTATRAVALWGNPTLIPDTTAYVDVV